MWQQLRPLMKVAGMDPHRVENLCEKGTPDVNYTRGWLELKYVTRWPRRGGPLRVDHFTPEQRVWLQLRALSGGTALLMLKVGEEWLLFNGVIAAKYLGESTREQLYKLTIARWTSKPGAEELSRWL